MINCMLSTDPVLAVSDVKRDCILKHIGLTETGIEYVERGRRFDSFILYFSSVFQYGTPTNCNTGGDLYLMPGSVYHSSKMFV